MTNELKSSNSLVAELRDVPPGFNTVAVRLFLRAATEIERLTGIAEVYRQGRDRAVDERDRLQQSLAEANEASLSWKQTAEGIEHDRDQLRAELGEANKELQRLRGTAEPFMYSTSYCEKHRNLPWSMTIQAYSVPPRVVCPLCEPPDASKTPSHVSVTTGNVAGFCNPTQDGRPSAESTETVPNADKVAFSRLQTQAMSCDSAQDDRARPADETHKASAELKDRAAGETPMCAKPFCSKPASRGLYCDTCSPDDMSDPETGVPLTPWGKRK